MQQIGVTRHDTRELTSMFRSKSDLVTYLKFNRGYFMPSDSHITLRFLKDFLAGEKELMKVGDVMHFNVPHYEELSVDRIFNQVKDDAQIIKFMNYYPDYQQLPDRKYFYGILGTLWPGYVQNILNHANKVRNVAQQEEQFKEQILIRDDIFKKLEQEPFFSKSKGKALQMLKQKSQPRSSRKKRQEYEISKTLLEFKDEMGKKENKANNKGQQIIQQQQIHKIQPGDLEMME